MLVNKDSLGTLAVANQPGWRESWPHSGDSVVGGDQTDVQTGAATCMPALSECTHLSNQQPPPPGLSPGRQRSNQWCNNPGVTAVQAWLQPHTHSLSAVETKEPQLPGPHGALPSVMRRWRWCCLPPRGRTARCDCVHHATAWLPPPTHTHNTPL